MDLRAAAAGMGFAAGAMMYLVVEELLPDAGEDVDHVVVASGFTAGLVLMMVLAGSWGSPEVAVNRSRKYLGNPGVRTHYSDLGHWH